MSMKKPSINRKYIIPSLIILLGIVFFTGKLFLDRIYVPVIIMYHSIDNEPLKDYGGKLNVKPYTFARQMKFLHDNKYNVIPLRDFILKIKKGEKIPPRTIAITLDDGLRNIFFYAYPALERYSFPATIFIPSEWVGKANYLTLEDIKTMQKDNISVESHTLSHRWLPDLDEKTLRTDLEDSKKILEKMTGEHVDILCYPLGGFNEKVKKIAEESGYIGAVTTSPGRKFPNNDPYALKRVRISMSSNNLFVFGLKTSGYYMFIKEVRDSN